jgi:hypothetical protein
MTERGRTVLQSPNEEWIMAPAFVVRSVWNLTMKCHGIGKLLCDVFSDVDAFEVKLDLFHKHISEKNL